MKSSFIVQMVIAQSSIQDPGSIDCWVPRVQVLAVSPGSEAEKFTGTFLSVNQILNHSLTEFLHQGFR